MSSGAGAASRLLVDHRRIIGIASFVKLFQERIKVGGEALPLGKSFSITRDKSKIACSSDGHLSKRSSLQQHWRISKRFCSLFVGWPWMVGWLKLKLRIKRGDGKLVTINGFRVERLIYLAHVSCERRVQAGRVEKKMQVYSTSSFMQQKSRVRKKRKGDEPTLEKESTCKWLSIDPKLARALLLQQGATHPPSLQPQGNDI